MKSLLLCITLLFIQNTFSRSCFWCTLRYWETDNTAVCGKDGVTYKHHCYAWCNRQPVLYSGACNNKSELPCGCSNGGDRVCDIDGKMYTNSCEANCYGKFAIPLHMCN